MKKTRHTTDQIIKQLRQADIALGKGQQVSEICKIGDHRTDVLPLAAEVWWDGAGDGQAAEVSCEGERSAEEAGGRAGA